MVSKTTDKILPEMKEWQSKPLDPVFLFIFINAIHCNIREDGSIINRATYAVLGVFYKSTTAFSELEIIKGACGKNPLMPLAAGNRNRM